MPESDNKVARTVSEFSIIVDYFLDHSGIVWNTDEMALQVLSAYVFGMLNAQGMSIGLTPPEIHAVLLALLNKKLGYSLEGSAQFAQQLINATKPQFHPTINHLIHRGIDGHAAWMRGQHALVVQDYLSCLEQLQRK